MNRLFKIAPVLAALACSARADLLFQLIPATGAVWGMAGDTVGWGFTITNTTDYVQITNSEYCEGAQTPPCTSSLGSYQDFVATNFTVVGPAPDSPVLTQNFDPLAMLGVGAFTIDPGAHGGDHPRQLPVCAQSGPGGGSPRCLSGPAV